MNEFIQKLNEYNLCTWYVLPLIGLNKADFSDCNFIDSYLTKDLASVVVQIVDINLCSKQMDKHKDFSSKFCEEECEFLKFSIPVPWLKDIQTFADGRFSQLSSEAKDLIRRNSGLKYKQKDEAGNLRTDAILLALEKAHPLKLKWEEVLSANSYYELPPDIELLSKPTNNSFK